MNGHEAKLSISKSKECEIIDQTIVITVVQRACDFFQVYRRITLILVVCAVVIVCFKISMNQTIFDKVYSVDRTWWSASVGNYSSADMKFTWPSTILLENISKPFEAVDEDGRASPKFTTVNTITYSTETGQVKKATKPVIRQIYSANATNKRHPNENDRLKIASGEYKVEDLMTVVNITYLGRDTRTPTVWLCDQHGSRPACAFAQSHQGPFQFLKNYKSPCWVHAMRNKTEPTIRCLPYFYLVGAPKCGTTDLHHRLVQHPNVSRRVVKEPHWLTRRHYYSTRKTNSSFDDYLKFFTSGTREVILEKDSKGYHSHVFGDCSASTLWDNNYWTILPQFQNLSEPKYTNADYIHHLNPNTKIIAMIRNPIDRLYSDYLFFQHGSPELFHEQVVEILNATYACLNQHTLRMCLYTPQHLYTDVKVRLRIGVYHLHLKEYLRVFPPDQVMVIKLEDFSKNILSHMQKVFAFLELPELEADDLEKIANPEKHANQRRGKDKKAGDMLAETRRMLEEFYRPHNDLLTELLEDHFGYNSDTTS